MSASRFESVVEVLRSHGVSVTPGLSSDELDAIESDLHFRLPLDLREMLSTFVPAGPGFPDWRAPRSEQMLEWLDEPSAGIEFDVEENGVWLSSWGERPDDIDDAIEEVHRLVAEAPVLIPLHAHQYLPAEPLEGGAPVLSVDGTDVAIIAPTLEWWLHEVWNAPQPEEREPEAIVVRFWTDLLG